MNIDRDERVRFWHLVNTSTAIVSVKLPEFPESSRMSYDLTDE